MERRSTADPGQTKPVQETPFLCISLLMWASVNPGTWGFDSLGCGPCRVGGVLRRVRHVHLSGSLGPIGCCSCALCSAARRLLSLQACASVWPQRQAHRWPAAKFLELASATRLLPMTPKRLPPGALGPPWQTHGIYARAPMQATQKATSPRSSAMSIWEFWTMVPYPLGEVEVG
jgi:hypothetical protein